MARRNDLGVRVVFRCPGCGDQHEESLPAGRGHYPGQVIEEPHLPGFCPETLAGHQLACPGCPDCDRAMEA